MYRYKDVNTQFKITVNGNIASLVGLERLGHLHSSWEGMGKSALDLSRPRRYMQIDIGILSGKKRKLELIKRFYTPKTKENF